MEKLHLLLALLLHRLKVLLMGSAEICQHGNGGLNDVAQGSHLARHADASLKDAHLSGLVHQPNAQGNANLRVVAAGRTGDNHRGREQLIEPLLDHRLAVGTSNANDGDVESVSVALGQTLQGLQRTDNFQEVCFGVYLFVILWYIDDNKVAHAPTIELRNVVVAVVALRV